MAWKLDISLVKPDTKAFLTEITKLERKLKSLDKSIRAVDKSVQSHGAKIDTASTAYRRMTAPIGGVDAALAKMGNQVEKTNRKLKKTKSVLKSINDSFVGMNAKIALGRQAFALLGGVIKSLTEDTIRLETAVVAVSRIAEITSKGAIKGLTENFRQLSLDIPLAASEIARFAETAARFGIRGTDNITNFAETFAKFGVVTGEVSDKMVRSFARIAQLTDFPVEDIDKLSNAIIKLGNSDKTTEGAIVTMAERLAGDLSSYKVSTAAILALATTFTTVGIKAELGGTLASKSLNKIVTIASRGGEKLDKLAAAAGITSDEFLQLANDAPIEIFQKLINSTESARRMMDLLGLSGDRMSKVYPNLHRNADIYNKALENGTEGLTNVIEAEKQFAAQAATTAGKIQTLSNSWEALKSSLGATEKLTKGVDALKGFSDAANSTKKDTGSLQKAIDFLWDNFSPSGQVNAAIGQLGDFGIWLGVIQKANRELEKIQKAKDKFIGDNDFGFRAPQGIGLDDEGNQLVIDQKTRDREKFEKDIQRFAKESNSIEKQLAKSINKERLAGLDMYEKRREKINQLARAEFKIAADRAKKELLPLKEIQRLGGRNTETDQGVIRANLAKLESTIVAAHQKGLAKLDKDEDDALKKAQENLANKFESQSLSLDRNTLRLENNNKRLDKLNEDKNDTLENSTITSLQGADSFILSSAKAQLAQDKATEAAKETIEAIKKSNTILEAQIVQQKILIAQTKKSQTKLVKGRP